MVQCRLSNVLQNAAVLNALKYLKKAYWKKIYLEYFKTGFKKREEKPEYTVSYS